MFGPEIVDAFREVKRAFDPEGIMNPGKIFDCPPMTENLRYGTGYRAETLPTTLDFSMDADYAGAVEMCNGMGACRQLTGTMCPSYMATRDEEHSTRGRANLLRAALSGKLPEGTMTGRRLYEALDLCLECKGCKAECESGVDMAKLKYEFLSNYYQANKAPLRAKFFSRINSVNRLGSRLAPFSNWAAASPLGRLVSQRIMGIHPHRQLPRFAGQSFEQWFRRNRAGLPHRGDRGTVALFNDTFMNYNHPQVGVAALELLEAAGFRVELASSGCCGRPMISKGFLDEAVASARANVEKTPRVHRHGRPHNRPGA